MYEIVTNHVNWNREKLLRTGNEQGNHREFENVIWVGTLTHKFGQYQKNLEEKESGEEKDYYVIFRVKTGPSYIAP